MNPADNEDEQFWQLVDAFIESANDAAETIGDPAPVAAALLQACARFNAFTVAAASLDRKAYAQDIPPALDFLSRQFQQELEEDLEDYRENYKVYIANERDETLH